MTTVFGVSSFVFVFAFDEREKERESEREREKKERHSPSRMVAAMTWNPSSSSSNTNIESSSFVPLARRPRATTTPRGRPILLPSRRSWSFFEILVSTLSTQAVFLVCLLDDGAQRCRKKRRKQERVRFCASIGKTSTSRRNKKKVRRRRTLF